MQMGQPQFSIFQQKEYMMGELLEQQAFSRECSMKIFCCHTSIHFFRDPVIMNKCPIVW